MRRIQLRAHGKINWTLRVKGKRPDGYHELETLFQSISLHDTITIEEAAEFSCRAHAPGVPSGEENLALRAARRISEESGTPPVSISIEKRIPAGGGLGGGSSDAAAVLRGMVALFELRLSSERLQEIALDLGSDVPFFLIGGLALGYGRGEILTPLPDESPSPLLLVFPEEHISTTEVFGACRGEVGEFNDLEPIVFARYPHFTTFRNALLECGAEKAFMTGSGSTIVGSFETVKERDAALARLSSLARCAGVETISRSEALAM